MRKAYISDIHANIEALEAVLDDIESRGIKDIVCFGDIVGYGPNPGKVLDRMEELANAKGINLTIIPGNHDPAFVENLDRRVRKLPKQKASGVGTKADLAIERQLDIMFTPRTAEFLSGEAKGEILRKHPPKYPPGFPGTLKEKFEEKILKAKSESPFYSSLGRIWAAVWPPARERWVVAQHGEHAHAEALGVTFAAAAYIVSHNPELVEHLIAVENAHRRKKFIEAIEKGSRCTTVNGVQCSHANWKGGTQYLLDKEQGSIFSEYGILDELEIHARQAERKECIDLGVNKHRL